MSRKRYCEDCGNICDDERCPICGRRTQIYKETVQRNEDMIDASKYRSFIPSDVEDQSLQEETYHDKQHREHRYHHAGKPLLRLHMEKGGHPYYEHIHKKKQNNPRALLLRVAVVVLLIMAVVSMFIAVFTSFSHEEVSFEEVSRDDTYDYVTGNIDMREVHQQVDIESTLTEYDKEEHVQKVTMVNDSPYLVKMELLKDNDIVEYVTLPAYSTTDHLLFDSEPDSYRASVYGVYEMDVEQPQIAYEIKEAFLSGYEQYNTLLLKESADEEELNILMRYLYAQSASQYAYDPADIAIYEGSKHLYDASINYEEGIIWFERIDADHEMYDIYIEN